MKHPAAPQIALFAGGDLGRWERWRIARHVAGCSECRHELEALRDAAGQLRQLTDEMADLPNSLNWNRLAQEMTGNIRVGLAAGEAIALFDKPLRNKPRLGWNVTVLVLGATVIFGIAFWTSLPPAGRALVVVIAAHSHRTHRNLGAFGRRLCWPKP